MPLNEFWISIILLVVGEYERKQNQKSQTWKGTIQKHLVVSSYSCTSLVSVIPKLHLPFLKVARVVKWKLFFMEQCFDNLVAIIKLYKIRYLNLDKALLFPRNQAICLKNWKLWRAPTATKFNIFCWNFAHVSYLTMSTKGGSGFFYFV